MDLVSGELCLFYMLVVVVVFSYFYWSDDGNIFYFVLNIDCEMIVVFFYNVIIDKIILIYES